MKSLHLLFSATTILLLVATAHAQRGQCTLTASTFNCAACSYVQAQPDGSSIVKVNLNGCKGGETLSWMCCRTAGCARADDECNGTPDAATSKCDEVTWAKYSVPAGTSSILVQIHDGKIAGDIDCASTGRCCGGAGTSCTNAGTVSGVVEQTINLASCPVLSPSVGPSPATVPPTAAPQCVQDSDCPSKSCSSPVCTAGVCGEVPKAVGSLCRGSAGACDATEHCDGVELYCPADVKRQQGTECRASAGACDVAEVCDGVLDECPANAFASSAVVCRDAADVCDSAEYCSGTGARCPEDQFLPSTTTCRASAGPCDVDEMCTGAGASCPSDAFKIAGYVCRESAGVCDVSEMCSGSSADCPTDAFKPSSTICRAAVRAADGTTCDADEFCVGNAAACPANVYLPAGTTCRANADKCDVQEVCAGGTPSCPAVDLRNDNGYVFKCAKQCYVCGVKEANLKIGSGNQKYFGQCGTGNCDSFIELPWPQCVDQCVNARCPNNRGLSNTAVGQCVKSTGDWNCLAKYEGAAVEQGVCPFKVWNL